MKRKTWIFTNFTMVTVIVAAMGICLRGAAKEPAGQKTLTKLSAANSSEFEAAFDAGADGPRVILQASPT
jgi:hypothetical protein